MPISVIATRSGASVSIPRETSTQSHLNIIAFLKERIVPLGRFRNSDIQSFSMICKGKLRGMVKTSREEVYVGVDVEDIVARVGMSLAVSVNQNRLAKLRYD